MNSGRSGRGPTIDMSPLSTFQNCGSSSMSCLRSHRVLAVLGVFVHHPQQVATRELVIDIVGENSVRHVADVELHAVAFVRRIGHGKVAALAVRQNHFEILASLEMDAESGGKAQMHEGDVVGDTRDAEYAGGQRTARKRVDLLDLARGNFQIRARARLARRSRSCSAAPSTRQRVSPDPEVCYCLPRHA